MEFLSGPAYACIEWFLMRLEARWKLDTKVFLVAARQYFDDIWCGRSVDFEAEG